MAKLREKHPDAIIQNAVRRMLPRSALGRDMMRKLRVYAGSQHPHVAQKPEPLKLSV
jgi:large subunit ribosomal protein L13